MKKPKDQILVIFGASGDLTYRKLIPALYALYDQNMMPEKFQVIGVGRTPLCEEAFLEKMTEGIREFSESNHLHEDEVQAFSKHLSYIHMDVYDPKEYLRLKSYMDDWCVQQQAESNYLFYMSLLPSAFGPIAKNLAAAGLQSSATSFRRLIVEKPFGYDLDSALVLNSDLHEAFAKNRFTALTITWARKPYKTCW